MHRIMFLTARCGTGRGSSGPRPVGKPSWIRAVGAAVAAASAGLPVVGESVSAGGARGHRNFVVHGVAAERSLVISDRAESLRTEVRQLLIGAAAGDPWRPACEVHVHPTAASFARAVGGSPAGAVGATSPEFSTDRVTLRRIDVMGDGPEAMPDGLAHEIAHVVLADRFIAAPPPRWADEGLALLFDPPAKQRLHDTDFREAFRHGRAWAAAELLMLEDYPAGTARQRIFYGQSAALVRWLVARRDARAFVEFAAACGEVGTTAALVEHYGIDSVDELEVAWSDPVPIDSGIVAALSPH